MVLSLSSFLHPRQAPMLHKTVHCWVHNCTLFLDMALGCSGVLVVHLLTCICTELTQLYSFFGFPGLGMLRQNKGGMCIERTITLNYYMYKFINLETKYKHECYLGEPGARCSSHTSLSSICLLVGVKLSAFSVSAWVSACQEQAESLRAPTYIIR